MLGAQQTWGVDERTPPPRGQQDHSPVSEGLRGTWHLGCEMTHSAAYWVILDPAINLLECRLQRARRIVPARALGGSSGWRGRPGATNFVRPWVSPFSWGLSFPICRGMGNEDHPLSRWWEGDAAQNSGAESCWGRSGLGETPRDGLKGRAGEVGAAGMASEVEWRYWSRKLGMFLKGGQIAGAHPLNLSSSLLLDWDAYVLVGAVAARL